MNCRFGSIIQSGDKRRTPKSFLLLTTDNGLWTASRFLQILQICSQFDSAGGYDPFFVRLDELPCRIVLGVLAALEQFRQDEIDRVAWGWTAAQEGEQLGPDPAQMDHFPALSVFATAQNLHVPHLVHWLIGFG